MTASATIKGNNKITTPEQSVPKEFWAPRKTSLSDLKYFTNNTYKMSRLQTQSETVVSSTSERMKIFQVPARE